MKIAGSAPSANIRRQARAGGCYRVADELEQDRDAPAHPPAGLHHPDGAAPIFGADGLPHEDGAGRPFATETETQQRARGEKLAVILGEGAKQCAAGEPEHGELQRADPADAIGKEAGQPAAYRRAE